MSPSEQGLGTLVILAAFIVMAAVLGWALWPYLQQVLDGLGQVGR